MLWEHAGVGEATLQLTLGEDTIGAEAWSRDVGGNGSDESEVPGPAMQEAISFVLSETERYASTGDLGVGAAVGIGVAFGATVEASL